MRTRRSPRRANPIGAIRSRWLSKRPAILWSSALFLFFFLTVVGTGRVWARNDAEPSVRVLGSGSHLSILITSGNARMLIASGDDATAFGNALGHARELTSRRIDILILAGAEEDAPVARYARSHLNAREVFVMDGPLTAFLGDLQLSSDKVIAKRIRISLPGEIGVTIGPDKVDEGSWRAVIQHGSTRILAGNDSEALAKEQNPVTAVVYAAKFDSDLYGGSPPSAMVISTRSASPSELREIEPGDGQSLQVARVEPATAVRLIFIEHGLRLDARTMRIGGDATP